MSSRLARTISRSSGVRPLQATYGYLTVIFNSLSFLTLSYITGLRADSNQFHSDFLLELHPPTTLSLKNWICDTIGVVFARLSLYAATLSCFVDNLVLKLPILDSSTLMSTSQTCFSDLACTKNQVGDCSEGAFVIIYFASQTICVALQNYYLI